MNFKRNETFPTIFLETEPEESRHLRSREQKPVKCKSGKPRHKRTRARKLLLFENAGPLLSFVKRY